MVKDLRGPERKGAELDTGLPSGLLTAQALRARAFVATQGAVASAEKEGASIGERFAAACGSKASMWVGSTV
jgi:hypothetical protein